MSEDIMEQMPSRKPKRARVVKEQSTVEERLIQWATTFVDVAEINLRDLVIPREEMSVKAQSWLWNELFEIVKDLKDRV